MTPDLVRRMSVWAEEAGSVARAHFRRTGPLRFKAAQEAVTETDRRIETLLRARIAAAFPDDAVVGEEFGGPTAADLAPGTRVWHVDPIDGTLNFALGLPDFCTSLALMQGGQVLAACVHQPLCGDTFTALRGAGAHLNQGALRVSARAPLARAVVSAQLKKDGLIAARPEILDALLQGTFKLRKVGAIALELAWVAAGFYDGLVAGFRAPIKLYDVAAGWLLLSEAGGRLTDIRGGDYRAEGTHMVASNGRIHDELVSVVEPCLEQRPAD